MTANERGVVPGQTQQGGLVELGQAVEHPRAVGLQLRRGIGLAKRLAKRLGCCGTDVVREIISRCQAAREQRAGQLGERLAKRRGGQVDRLGQAPGFLSPIDQPPNAAHLTVAPGVVEPHLVVADDAVVKVGDVQRAVRAELKVDRPEPWVARAD